MNPFKTLEKHEWIIWIISILSVTISNIATKSVDYITLPATLLGVTALIFVAKGNVWGQILTIAFSLLYSVDSYKMKYYGEILTYAGMTLPSAVAALVTWLKNPFEKGINEVKIRKLDKKHKIVVAILTTGVTAAFYFILKLLGTSRLTVSTISVTTSFLASYLLILRCSWYAIAYAANDVVLIVLWSLASISDFSYFPMVICFLTFLFNDLYGFYNWKRIEKRQKRTKK